MAVGALAGAGDGVPRLVLDALLGVVPGAAGVGHEHGQELAAEDDAGQEPAQGLDLEDQADDERHEDRDQGQGHELLLGRAGRDADDPGVVGLDLALHEAGDLELAADLLDDEPGRAGDGLERQGAEQPGQGAAEEQPDEDLGVGHPDGVHDLGHAELELDPADVRDVGGEQAHGGDDRGGNGHALGDGFGRVADGVEVGHDLAGLDRLGVGLAVPGHLGDAVGVVGDGPVGVHGHVVAGVAEHADADHGHAVEDVERPGRAVEGQGDDEADADDDDRPDARLHADAQAGQDGRRGAGLGRVDDLLDRGLAGGREVGGQGVEGHGQADADGGQHGQLPVVGVVYGHDEGPQDGVDAGDLVGPEHGLFGVLGPQELDREALPDRHGEGAQDRGDDADGPDDQGIDDPLQGVGRVEGHQGQPQDQAGDDGHLVGLEDVGGHAGAVADVVADEVGHDGRVAGVVLGDVLLDLADEVGADVRGLGVDAAADPHEQGQQGAAEAEAQQGVGRGRAEDDEDEGAAEQAQAVGQHARDGPGVVGDGQGLVEAPPRGRGGPDVGLDGHAHAELPDEQRERGAHDEGDGPADGDDDLGVLGAEFGHGLAAGRHDVDAQEQGHGQGADDGQDLLELGLEVAVGAEADGVPDLLHLLGALVLLEDDLAQHPGVPEADEGGHHDAADGDLLERVQPMTGEP